MLPRTLAQAMRWDREPRDVAFDGDPERLSIVLANLVTNAIRHTAAGGRQTSFRRSFA